MALFLTRGCVEWCGAVPGGEPVTGGEPVDVADVGERRTPCEVSENFSLCSSARPARRAAATRSVR
jgi:hypothetical protein